MKKTSILSCLISLLGLILIVKGQYDLGVAFELADGKTQALYGLKNLGELKLSGFGLFALLLSIIASIRKEKKILVFSSLIFAILIMILPFSNLWKIWI